MKIGLLIAHAPALLVNTGILDDLDFSQIVDEAKTSNYKRCAWF